MNIFRYLLMQTSIKHCILVIFSILVSSMSFSQNEIKTIERFTNSYKNKKPKSDLYLVSEFSDYYLNLFFNTSDSCQVIIITPDNKREVTVLKKEDLYYNKKTGLYSYYHYICKSTKIPEQSAFDLRIVSNDFSNQAKLDFTASDKRKLMKAYGIKDVNSSNKKKLKHYKKTGDSQGQLMGDTQKINISKRKSCSAKKREFRKEGINGVKEMTYGM